MKIEEQKTRLSHMIAHYKKMGTPRHLARLEKAEKVTLTAGSDEELMQTLIEANKGEICVPLEKLELMECSFHTRDSGPKYDWLIALSYPFEGFKYPRLHSIAWDSETRQIVKLEL